MWMWMEVYWSGAATANRMSRAKDISHTHNLPTNGNRKLSHTTTTLAGSLK
jgi:hypothetical protein